MKKIFENFYIFSKFALSIILLICLIGTLYILYINYQKETLTSQKNNFFEEELRSNINKNSELINNLVNELKTNKTTLLDIKKNMESIKFQNNDKDISNLSESIKLLNNNFDELSQEILNLKKINLIPPSADSQDKSDFINSSIDEIINLILIKYENNISINNELKYLSKIIDEDKKLYIEKISILSTKPFKGHEYLKKKYNEEVNIFLKKIINKNPTSLFGKIVLPYLEISPTSENKITNDLIIKIKEVKLNIENRNIEKSYKNLQSIKDYDTNFKFTILEINKYLNFKNELEYLK